MPEILREYYLGKAKEYLTSLQQNLEEAGGLPTLWHERTKMMNIQDKSKLGNQLGITGEGKYGPTETLAYVGENATAIAQNEGPSHLKDLGASLITQNSKFKEQVNEEWTSYALDILYTQGVGAQAPTSEEIAASFKAGEYDEALTSIQQKLSVPENNLLQGYRDIQSEMAAYHIDMGQK